MTARRERDEVRVSVRDTGIGMAPEVLPTVFDLFVQGRQASNRAEGGLGLGLAIVRNLVERHGGRVLAHSDGIGRGSEFTVWVPMAPILASRDEPRRVAPVPIVAPRAPSSRVLIVDDNQDAADMLAHVLSSKGHETRVAHDGVEALRACADFSPHAAFLDLGLPVMDGYEFLTRLRKMPGGDSPKVVFCTTENDLTFITRALEAGANEYIMKPFDKEILSTKLQDAGVIEASGSDLA